MSLESAEMIDAIGIDTASNAVILTVIDSWDWNDMGKHLLALKAKLNAYLAFIEDGQLWKSYPNAFGRKIEINIVARFPLPSEGLILLDRIKREAAQSGITIGSQIHE